MSITLYGKLEEQYMEIIGDRIVEIEMPSEEERKKDDELQAYVWECIRKGGFDYDKYDLSLMIVIKEK